MSGESAMTSVFSPVECGLLKAVTEVTYLGVVYTVPMHERCGLVTHEMPARPIYRASPEGRGLRGRLDFGAINGEKLFSDR
jgi:hypothetical protein